MKHLVIDPSQKQGDRVVIEGKDFHYLVHVRRLGVGQKLTALCGSYNLDLEILDLGAASLVCQVVSEPVSAQSPQTEIYLFPFLLKSRKLDDVIRQACEAGVTDIVPIQGDHCVSVLESKGDQEKKLERWQGIIKEATQQSGSKNLCRIHPVLSSKNLCDWWASRGTLFFFHQSPLAKTSLHRYLFLKPNTVGLIVGPEGGLSPQETNLFEAKGAVPIWLGKTVLRAETASIYAVAAVQIILQENTEWTIPT